MTQDTSRRAFLQASAAAGLGFFVSGTSADETKPKAGLEKINVAAIGVGGKGGSDCDHAAKFGNLVAICDIDEKFLDAKAKKFPKAQKFFDFRELIGKLGDKIDAVVVSTPDHTHAPACSLAMRAGKHVYCQKPLTHSVHEARTLRELARSSKVCTQMGNQGTAHGQFRSSVELLRSGALGAIKEVHLWTNRPVWPQAPAITKRPPEAEVPKHVHWDLWLGPAPERPYAKTYYHDFKWRGWWDFGTGALGDMACHTANMPFMGLKLSAPSTISAEAGDVNPETYPSWAKVSFTFALPGVAEPIPVTWYEGKRDGKRVLPPLELLQGKKGFSDSGSLIVGENATVYSPDDYGQVLELIGKGAKDLKKPEPTLPRRKGDQDEQQKAEWFEAIAKGDPKAALSNFDYAGTLTEAILLGNVAIRSGKKLEYDGKKGEITNVAEANKLLSREYRSGWKL
ncbi:MAG: Gfo/Idh/MocA family oxidoreductase [Gemmataceae bacterium]|nr:Gfo/Idh/MocA family oxidoreductase [Gemmataceae bacterium]